MQLCLGNQSRASADNVLFSHPFCDQKSGEDRNKEGESREEERNNEDSECVSARGFESLGTHIYVSRDQDSRHSRGGGDVWLVG